MHNMPEVALTCPAATEDRGVPDLPSQFLGKAGIGYTTYAPHGKRDMDQRPDARCAGVRRWKIRTARMREGMRTQGVQRAAVRAAAEFTPQEISKNYTYFIEQWRRLPKRKYFFWPFFFNDPPVPVCTRGAALHLQDYRGKTGNGRSPTARTSHMPAGRGSRAERSSPARTRKKLIPRFRGEKESGRIIHFRNVSAPLPHLGQIGLDRKRYSTCGRNHEGAAGRAVRAGLSFSTTARRWSAATASRRRTGFAYMKALLNRANAEAKELMRSSLAADCRGWDSPRGALSDVAGNAWCGQASGRS